MAAVDRQRPRNSGRGRTGRRRRDGLEARPTIRTIGRRLRPRGQALLAALVQSQRPLGVPAQAVVRHAAVPLVAQVRLDHRVGAVGVAHRVAVGAHAFQQRALLALGHAAGLELGHHAFAGLFAGQADEEVGVAHVGPAVPVGDRGVRGHHVDEGGLGRALLDDGRLVAAPEFVVVGVVRGRDLEEARGHLGLGVALGPAEGDRQHHVVVLDQRDDAPDDRQAAAQPAQRRGPGIPGVHRHGHVAQVGLRAGGGDGDPGLLVVGVGFRARVAAGGQFAPGDGAVVLRRTGMDQRVAQVVERPVHLLHLHLVVGQSGLGDGVPVDQALAALDQPVLEQAEERLAHGPGADRVHREPLALPVAGAAHRLQLLGDAPLVLVLESLDFGDELLASALALGFHAPVFGQGRLALVAEALVHHGLGRDAGVVGAGHPQGLVPLHPVGAGEDVLDGVVQGVAQVQGGRDVGRGDQDGEGLGLAVEHAVGVGVEGVGVEPFAPHARLGLGGRVGLGEGGRGVRGGRRGHGRFRAAGHGEKWGGSGGGAAFAAQPPV